MKSKEYKDSVCRYFKKAGKKNTADVMKIAAERAEELGIRKILTATCSGKSALEALKHFDRSVKIIAVTHVTGFVRPDFQELSEPSRRKLEKLGITVLTCQHAFGGVGRGIRRKLNTYQLDEIMAYTLRTFGQGTKVAIELSLMAADAGLVRTDEDVISIGGTEEGADTALVIKPANSSNVFDLKIREIICKPADF
jgi:uncharacterized protein